MGRCSLWAMLFAAFAVGLAAACLLSPLGDWFSVEALKQSRLGLQQLVAARPLLCITGFFLLCVVATAVCFPAAPVLGVSGGALFGLWPGLPIVLVASLIGSTIAFFDARYLLRDWVKRRFATSVERIDSEVARHGSAYLLTLRLNPVVPYWLVNLAMGVTCMRLGTYVRLSAVGLIPATSIYVTAGTQLASIDSTSDIFSPGLIVSLLLLSLFPLVASAAGSLLRRRA